MRKVLLATTALVAMSVTAAQADISISGNIEFEYESLDAADTMYTDGALNVNSSMTADSGVTYGVSYAQKMEVAEVDAFYATVSSADMGTFYLGDADDDATGMMDGALGINNDIESENAVASTAIGSTGNMLTYRSPKIGGLQVGVSANSNADETSFALTYDMAGASIYFGSKEDFQNMAVKTSLAGFTIAVGSMKQDGTTAKASDVALKYTLGNGITLAGVSARATDSTGAKTNYKNVGASYSIAPGVAAKIESGDATGAKYTWMSLAISF